MKLNRTIKNTLSAGVLSIFIILGGGSLDTDEGADKWLLLNKKMSEKWPNITEKKDPPNDADDFVDVSDKYDKFFKE